MPRFRVHRPLETRRGILQFAGQAVKIAQAIVGDCEAGIDAQGSAVGRGGLNCAACLFENVPQVDEVVCAFGDRNGLAKATLRARRIALRRQ